MSSPISIAADPIMRINTPARSLRATGDSTAIPDELRMKKKKKNHPVLPVLYPEAFVFYFFGKKPLDRFHPSGVDKLALLNLCFLKTPPL